MATDKKFKWFMIKQARVIDSLASDFQLEQDTINEIVLEYGDLMREAILNCTEPFAVANLLNALKAGACEENVYA